MDNSFQVVGIERRSSQAGKKYKVLHLMQPFYKASVGEGSRVSTEYCAGDSCPDDVKVGSSVFLYYEKGFDGKAYVSGVRIVETAPSGDIPTVNTGEMR